MSNIKFEYRLHRIGIYKLFLFYWSTRPTSVPACSDHYFHTDCLSVHPKNSKIKRQSLPAGTMGWPSGSLMAPVLYFSCFRSKDTEWLTFNISKHISCQSFQGLFDDNCFPKVCPRILIFNIRLRRWWRSPWWHLWTSTWTRSTWRYTTWRRNSPMGSISPCCPDFWKDILFHSTISLWHHR